MTRIAVVGDVHGNLPALEAVIASAGEVDAWWCIGDTLGYGPCPLECVRRLRSLGATAVAGNHDLGCTGGIDLEHFNAAARAACIWTMSLLDEESSSYVASLPLREAVRDVLLVHGSPRDPVWEYVVSPRAALGNLEAFGEPVCFNGHSHVPVVFSWPRNGGTGGAGLSMEQPSGDARFTLEPSRRYLINAGSVGQPRDRDPRACFAVYSEEDREVSYHRVEYDIGATREKMREAGLPPFLSERLEMGI
ncbi:MAG: metallophosphatase family protein [Actinobacteria bacterium]|nr:metallophosphatase family protein [Actinomycetota bacterium]MBU1943903.1 metallophosphatase family protein [Actinomycetota bacterium]MBU2688575.1 metallophosphatase family protein [Actinomycetota bacterium]